MTHPRSMVDHDRACVRMCAHRRTQVPMLMVGGAYSQQHERTMCAACN